jgi:hypothetical protein
VGRTLYLDIDGYQLAVNLDVDMSLNGNPTNEISSPAYRNQNEYLMNIDMNAPVNVQPVFTVINATKQNTKYDIGPDPELFTEDIARDDHHC